MLDVVVQEADRVRLRARAAPDLPRRILRLGSEQLPAIWAAHRAACARLDLPERPGPLAHAVPDHQRRGDRRRPADRAPQLARRRGARRGGAADGARPRGRPRPVRARALPHRADDPARDRHPRPADARRPPADRGPHGAARVVPRRRAQLRPRRDARQSRPADHVAHADGDGRRHEVEASSTSTPSSSRPTSTRSGSPAGTSSSACAPSSGRPTRSPVRRVSEIMKWVRSGEYDRIMNGELHPPRRPVERPLRGGRRGRALRRALPRLLQATPAPGWRTPRRSSAGVEKAASSATPPTSSADWLRDRTRVADGRAEAPGATRPGAIGWLETKMSPGSTCALIRAQVAVGDLVVERARGDGGLLEVEVAAAGVPLGHRVLEARQRRLEVRDHLRRRREAAAEEQVARLERGQRAVAGPISASAPPRWRISAMHQPRAGVRAGDRPRTRRRPRPEGRPAGGAR